MSGTTRRKVGSAPLERPSVPVPTDFRVRLEHITESLTQDLLNQFDAGQLPTTAEGFQALEEGLLQTMRRRLVGPVLSEVLHALHDSDDFVLWSMGAARREQELKSDGDTPVSVQVAGGSSVQLKTPYMRPATPRGQPGPRRRPGSRKKGEGGLLPALAALGFVCRVSPFVASSAAKTAATLDSYEESVGVLQAQGMELDVDAVRRIVARMADAGLLEREEGGESEPETLAGKRVMLGIDGGRLRYRLPKGGRRRKNGRHGYETPWREPKIIAIYTIDENGKKTKDKPIYEGTLAPWKDAVDFAISALQRYGAKDAAQLVLAADGSDNIWREMDRLLDAVGIAPERVVKFVDFGHASGHLEDAAKLATDFETDQQRRQWAKKQAKLLKRGRVTQVILALEGLSTEHPKELETEIDYFRKRVDKLQYGELRKKGLPIGTGGVESAIRRIVNLRLKNTGTFWKPENAERILFLRCRLKSGRWADVEAQAHKAAFVPGRNVRPAVFSRLTI